MTKLFSTACAGPMSPRTAKYVEAMIREDFDYNEWLKEVREEEAEAKQVQAAITRREVVSVRADDPIKISGNQHVRSNPALSLIPKTLRVPIARRSFHQSKSQSPKARLRRRLEKVRRAWADFQASRARDAVYEYLAAVFAIVMHYKVRRRTTRLLRHAFEFASLPFSQDTDAFAAIIRCTSDNSVDSKTISKWARALRYVAHSKEPDIGLREFMKKVGGVNACAAAYAKS